MPMVFPTSPTVGQVFSSGGRSWVWTGSTWDSPSAANALQVPIGLEFIKSQTIGTAVTSVTVTDAFSARYDNYKIVVSGGAANGTNSVLRIQLGSATDGHSTTLIFSSYISATGVSSVANINQASLRYIGIGQTNGLYVNADLNSPFLTRPTIISATYADNTNTGIVGGAQTSSTSFTSFNLIIETGNMTGGTIAVYGYRRTT